MAVAEFLAEPGKPGLDQDDAAGRIAFLGDDRLLQARAAGLEKAFVLARPIVVSVSAEFGAGP